MAGDGPPAPSSEAPGPGKEHAELLNVLDALGAKKSQQAIAVDVIKAADPTDAWDPNAGPRSKSKRRIKRATALRDGGYRAKFLEPRRKRRRRRPDPGSGSGEAASST